MYGSQIPSLTLRIDGYNFVAIYVYSLLSVETADRPGLLVDLVKIITDINVAVESGEFDTEVTIIPFIKRTKCRKYQLNLLTLLILEM